MAHWNDAQINKEAPIIRRVMRAAIAAAVAVIALAACSQPAPTFSLAGASVDPTHWCPGGASNAGYDLHAKIDARNDTAKPVTIDAVSAKLTLAAVNGPWLEPVGQVYDAGAVAVAPTTVAARSRATLDVVIPSACTSNRYGTSSSSSGHYNVTLGLETSAGAFTVTASNRHEILAA